MTVDSKAGAPTAIEASARSEQDDVPQQGHVPETASVLMSYDNEPAIRRQARNYKSKGFALVVVRPNSKVATSKAWQNTDAKAEQFDAAHNIAFRPGAASGNVVDLDFDIVQARALSGAACFFGAAPSFRRTSLPPDQPGHRLVICRGAHEKATKFDFRKKAEVECAKAIGLAKTTVLEIRAGGCYTVIPPSSYDGDQLVFGPGHGKLPEVSWDDLRKRAGRLAFASVAAACYPTEGTRDEFCFNLAGALISSGIEPDEAENIIAAIVEFAGDDLNDRQGKALRAAEQKAVGEPVHSLRQFLEFAGLGACEKLFRGWLQLGDTPRAQLVAAGSIDVANPNIAERTQQIEDGLIGAGLEVFRLGDHLVYPSRLEADEVSEGVRRPKNLVRLRRATADWLTLHSSRLLTFVRASKEGERRVAPSADLMKPLEVAIEERKFPSVNGLVATPTLTRNEPGYDAASKLYLSFEPNAFGDIPFEASKEDARAALDELFKPAMHFPFESDADKSVWLAAMLTATVRGHLSRCPAFIFDAPSAGSGKTYLCEMVGVMGLGVMPPGASWGESDEENSKVLFAMLREADPVMLFDNVTTEIGSADLCKALTSSTIKGRILGVSENAILGTRTLMMFNGNNVRVAGDMTRRAVRCRVDAKMEKPEERTFDFHPVRYVEENRSALVAAALIVLRAYVSAGKPVKLSAFNSFEDWDLVRGALVWLGEADPFETVRALKSNDPRREQTAELFIELLKVFGAKREFRSADIKPAMESLYGTVRGLIGKSEFNTQAVGQLLKRSSGKPLLGVTLRSRKSTTEQSFWRFDGEPEQALREAAGLDADGHSSNDREGYF